MMLNANVNINFSKTFLPGIGNPSHYLSMMWDATSPDPQIHTTGFSNWDYFKQIKLVTLDDSGNETSILADFDNPEISGNTDGTDGQVMVKLPKFYYKEHYNTNGWLTGLELSTEPKSGLALHPKFLWGNGRDCIYVGAYEASEVSGILSSVSGQDVKASITIDAARALTYIRDTGSQSTSGWHLLDYWTHHLINTLFYGFFGNLNSQIALPGYTEANHWNIAYRRNTGRSDILTSITGNVDVDLDGLDLDLVGVLSSGNKITNRFLFIENVFGHLNIFLDGVSFDGRIGAEKKAYLTADPRIFSSVEADILSNYSDVFDVVVADSNMIIQAMGPASIPIAGIPVTTPDGYSQYYCDIFDNRLSDTAARDYLRSICNYGALYHKQQAGINWIYSAYPMSDYGASQGFRLMYETL